LRQVLRNDFEGQESLRQYLIAHLPRFGQDRAEVDALAAEEARFYADCWQEHRTYYGDRFWPMIFGVSTQLNTQVAPKTGATPSGRRTGEELSMTLQPSPAGPRGPITAVLRSCAVIDFTRFPGGVSNVQEFDPTHFDGPSGIDRLVQVFQGFFDLGGMEIAPNFLSEEQLRAAQRAPDRYTHLMVRLFGLSARFVSLSPELQESIIQRVRAARSRNA